MNSLQQTRTEYEVNKYLHLVTNTDGGDSRSGSSFVSDALNDCLELAIMRLAVHGAFIVLTEGSRIHPVAGGHKLDPDDALSKVEFGTGESAWSYITDSDLSRWHWLFQQTTGNNVSPQENQIFTVPDLEQSDRFTLSNKTGSLHLSFYAGVPLVSKGHQTIGVLFVVDTAKRSPLSTSDGNFLKYTTKRCVNILENGREQSFHNRWTSMQKQLEFFTQSQSLQTYEWGGYNMVQADERYPERVDVDVAAQKALAGMKMTDIEGEESERLGNAEVDREKSMARRDSVQDASKSATKAEDDSERNPRKKETVYRKVFRRAAQCLQTALEADGVLFADSLNGFHGDIQTTAESEHELEKELSRPHQRNSDLSEDSSEFNIRTYSSPGYKKGVGADCPADILAISEQSDQPTRSNDLNPTIGLPEIDEGFLRRLMDRHPISAMWYFTDTSMMQAKKGTLSEYEIQNEEEERLRTTFPKIRQLMFMTLHDPTSGKRLSACFVWRNRAYPVFTDVADLGSFKMFLHVVESEIGRLDTCAVAKQKETFVSSVSHELRTPLHGILGAVQLLDESGLDPLQKSLADIITSCGSTLHETLTSVLSYAKINQFKRRQQEYRRRRPRGSQWALPDKSKLDSSNLDPEEFQGLYIGTNVAMLCEELVGVSESGRSFQSSANEEVIVVCNISYEDSWYYFTEPGALRRIAVNIIGNALKYTKIGSIIVSLTASEPTQDPGSTSSVESALRTLTLSVEDTGKGMSKSFLQDHLFVPFTQEDSTSSHGVGLGMSIVKNLVSLLSGEIQVQSKVGFGTKITVALPMRMCDPEEDKAYPAFRFEQNIQTLRARQLSVIVFGFPDFVRSSLETYLREWYNCTLLEATDEAHPDIILVDEGDEETLEEVKRTAHVYGREGVLLSAVLVISKMGKRMDTIEGYKKWERIPRPIGPSNVAKGLLGCLSKLDELRKYGDNVSSDKQQSGFKIDKRTEELSSDNPEGGSMELPMWAFQRLQLSNNRETAPLEEELSTSPSLTNQDPPPKASEVDSQEPDSKRDSRLRILLVDDNALNLRLLRAFFRRNGYHNIQQAKHGGEAVEAVQKCAEGFDIVFMDMSMPVMDGFEATRQIRRLEAEQKSPSGTRPTFVTALTGLASASDEEAAFNAGVDMYLTKPVQFPRLSTLLRECEEGTLKTSRALDES